MHDRSPIRIGYCLSLTGALARNGQSARLAHEIWRDDVNRSGGLLGRPVELICHDDGTDASRVEGLYRRLLDDQHVDLIIGGYGTNTLRPTMPLVIDRRRFFVGFMGLGVNRDFGYPGWRRFYSEWSPRLPPRPRGWRRPAAAPARSASRHFGSARRPTSVLRTTGYGPNIFAFESFIDELAHRKGQDPYRYRRELLGDNARALKVLDLAAEKSAWTSVAAAGHFRGIAFCEAFRTLTAHVMELSVPRQGVIRIHRVTCVVDSGTVLDPGISANSMEGGVAWGLSCAFLSETTFARGRAVESHWHDYQVLRMPEMPPVDVHFVDSGVRPLGGIGEVGPITVLPALTNAIFRATGQRYRSLPLSRHGLSIG